MSIVVALITPRIKVGAVKFNTSEIISCINKAKKADLLVFPRLAITGATARSMFEFPLLVNCAKNALIEIAEASDKPTIIGLPTVKDGKVYDSVAVIKDGKTNIYNIPKGMADCGATCLNYGNDDIPAFEVDGVPVKVEAAPISSENELIVVPTAYPSYIGGVKISLSGSAVIVSSGKGESVSGRIFSGDKIAISNGKIEEKGGYDDEIIFYKFGKNKLKEFDPPYREISLTPKDEECALAYDIMGRGIVGRMNEIGADKVILGLSGGLDSTNVLVATVLAFEKYKLDKRNILCVTMRGGGSSNRTQDNAAALIENYKVTGINVPIDAAINLHMRSINHEKKDVVYENAQARERTQILLDLSNKYNALMLGTGDLSEICLGWSTFGGDQISHYNPNCSLTKTAIRSMLKRYIFFKHNKAAAKIIEDILDTPISPELISGQETEVILGPYEVHDFFIEELISKKLSPKEALSHSVARFDLTEDTLKKYMNLFITRFFRFQFKRNFGPDGVKLFPYDLYDLDVRSDFIGELWLKDI